MRIRALIAALLFLIAVLALASPAAAHHRPGHTGGPGTEEDRSDEDKRDEDEDERETEREEESDEGRQGTTDRTRAEGHGGEDEAANQKVGAAVSLAVIAGAVVLIAGLGLKPADAAPAQH